MSEADFQLHGIRDPRLAALATSALPAWVWSINGAHILWANTIGARLFGERSAAALAERTIGPADPHRRQAAQLAARLSPTGAPRLERLRGFGAPLGRLLTCTCARLTFADGSAGILIAATEPVGRPLPLTERLAHLVDSVSMPAMTFTPEGALAGANDAAKNIPGLFGNLNGPGFDEARSIALRDGQAAMKVDLGRVTLHRVGSGDTTALVALIDTVITPRPAPKPASVIVEPAEPVAEKQPVEEPAPVPVAAMMDTALDVAALPHAQTTPEAVDDAPEPQASGISPDVLPSDVFGSAFDDALETESPAQSSAQPVAPKIDAAEPASPPEPAHHDAPADAPVTRIFFDDARKAPADENAASPASAIEVQDEPVTAPQQPLRFTWHMDEHNRFSLGHDEFSRLIGTRTAAAFGRPWAEIAHELGLDPDNRVTNAAATRESWSNIVVHWPADGTGARLPVELSGLPIYDHAGEFLGYRGFGVCRDIDGMARLASQRRSDVTYAFKPDSLPEEAGTPEPIAEDIVSEEQVQEAKLLLATDEPVDTETAHADASTQDNMPSDMSPQTETRPPVDIPQNVVPFPVTEPKAPTLTAVESNAFDELARRLSAQLDNGGHDTLTDASVAELFAADEIEPAHEAAPEPPAMEHPPAFLQPEPVLPRANAAQDLQLFDRLPVGVLVYRLDRLLYANRAFFASTGYDDLHALTEAGGLDALTIEAGAGSASSSSETGTPVVIAATSASGPNRGEPAKANLFAITWDGEPAHALIFSGPRAEPRVETPPTPAVIAPVIMPREEDTQAEELATILDNTAESVVVFDGEGHLLSCNRSAEALFGRDDNDMAALTVADLFAPESQRAVLDYVNEVKAAPVAGLVQHDRELLGRARDGHAIPLSMTIGRTQPNGPRFFAIFRDLSQMKKGEGDLVHARRQADRATSAKADILGRISHEVRMPLNAIIGFADVMIEERFGALGNERYVEYMKDIRASGQRVIAIIDDLLDLSRIESGKMELSFASQDLNSMVEQCVAVMQPQANRERIIIRTSLAHALPTVKADARALRQIAMNLIGNSIHLANAGGQVIVSTATTDFGDIVLRVRDTGHGLNDNEIAAAMAPFRTSDVSDQTADGSVVNLSLTKALVEANRAQFHIKTAPHSGTLIEVVFSHASAIA
ncbi:PAS domain S-box protein [Afipia clevelandensis]|uniref:histidine kinase n=1 Tax=Afipia clevelandensis ATCC 49720 TaxID=883079 RepID=K8P6D0_9BRAD|nr:PAS domain S-box protein [Afipia clevelandensis]EKS35190.1 PAS domain S-box protein [Afipia clevelandensis ATCC 49720]